MSLQTRQVYEFGDYRVDAGLCRLLRGVTPVALPPRAFDLLLLLVRNPGRVLSKQELLETLWPNTFVDEGNITQHVFTLRKALGVQPDGTAYIETAPRRGYIFTAAVRGTLMAESLNPPGATAIAVDGERKQATVVHCGVANAAELAERLGPERLDELVRDLTRMAEEEAGRYEGLLRRTRTDAFEAVFGAHVAHEDDALRAVLTALAIRDAVSRLAAAGTAVEDRPTVRIGINTGQVVISRRAADHGVEYSAIGEITRVADLLQQIAGPGSILIGHATRRAVEGSIVVERTEIEAGGASAFRVTGATPLDVPRAPRFLRSLTPFVGRVHELGLLANLTMAVRARRGQVVSVIGAPGIGKSRLLLEFTNATPDFTMLEARCVSYGSLVPYLPLAQIVRGYCGIREDDDAEDAFRAVRETIAPIDLPGDAGGWLLRLLGLAGSDTQAASPEAVKTRTFDVLRALLLHAGTVKPLAIIVEDAQWIDRTSEEFLAALVDRIVAAPILLIVTFRAGHHVPWRDRSYVTNLTLTPLAAADAEVVMGAVVRDAHVPSDVSAEILRKAEGNPFFLEELIRTVIEHGPDHGTPDTVHAVIMARLDRLPGATKRLLQTASVLGRDVPLRLLSRVWQGAPDITPALEELCRLEFLYERDDGDDRVFVFTHALTQEVAYDSLLVWRRRDLHLTAARALEELHAGHLDDITAMLAYHYARTEVINNALTWLIRAADRAARVYANAEAILHLDLASRRLDRLPEGPERDRRELEVALKRAYSLYFLGRWQESVDVLLPQEMRVVRANDPALTAAHSLWLANMYTRLGDQRQAREQARRALDAAARAGDTAAVGKAHGVLALSGHWSGTAAEGVGHGEAAVRILSAHPDQQWWLGMAQIYLAMNHVLAGNFEAGLTAARCADEVAHQIGDPRLRNYAGWATGWLELSRGHVDEAIAASRASLEHAPDRVSRAYALVILSFALLEKGEQREALEYLQPTQLEFAAFPFPQWEALASVLLGEALRLDGSLEQAERAVQHGIEVATHVGYGYAADLGERIRSRIQSG